VKPPKIIVCIKNVPDPEGPSSAFEIHSDTKKVVPIGIAPVINPYDQNALEAAIRLKDTWGGKVIALNMAVKAVTPVLQKALSVGADELVVLEDPAFQDLTSRSTAKVLAAGIRKIGSCDLILTGRQAADWDFGQVGILIAEILHIPAVNLAQAVQLQEDGILVEKLRRVGSERVMVSRPALITVSSEVGDLRLPSLKAIQDARKKPVTRWKLADLAIEPDSLKMVNIRSLTAPPSRSRTCFLVDGDSPQEKGTNLALRLRQDKVL
jgi:electron transfer flavoprotein beta subunit